MQCDLPLSVILVLLIYQMSCPIGAIDFFSFRNRLETPNTRLQQLATVTISAERIRLTSIGILSFLLC
jgi:hypothetical protein